MNKLISCVALLSCSLMGCGDHGSRGITAHLPGDEEPTQPEWITVIPPQQSTDGNYWPVNALNAYFDGSNYVGVVGYGAYYTTQSITVPALCIKFLGEHCVDGKRDGTTYTLSNTWVGGQAARFYNSCSVPCDYVPKRSYPLFRARGVLEVLGAGRDAGSPEGDRSPAPRRARPRP